MNNEIKEIRDILFELQFLGNEETQSKVVKLHNYITNLQHQILLMEEDIRESKEINGELQQDNEKNKEYSEFYKDMSDKWKDLSDVFKKSCNDYKSRCEKAVEYTAKQKKKMYKSRNKIAMFILMKLENILQNGSDSNDPN